MKVKSPYGNFIHRIVHQTLYSNEQQNNKSCYKFHVALQEKYIVYMILLFVHNNNYL